MHLAVIIFLDSQNGKKNKMKKKSTLASVCSPGFLYYLNWTFSKCNVFSASELFHLIENKLLQTFYLFWIYYLAHLSLYENPWGNMDIITNASFYNFGFTLAW